MIRSMTAYGRASHSTSGGQWVVEIHSVNRKMLDITINLPKEWLRFDIEIRKWLSEVLQRGQIFVRVHLARDEQAFLFSPGFTDLLKQLKQHWDKLALELKLDPKQVMSLPFLAQQAETYAHQNLLGEQENVDENVKELIQAALREVMKMKEKEGALLQADIEARLKMIEDGMKKISTRSSHAVQRYRDKLKERILEVCAQSAEWDERLGREVALFAEKIDIEEELTRLKSHLVQFHDLMRSKKEKTMGRTLDFLTQEMNREINTIASKSSDVDISHLTVMMKSELERIREQVQNIE